MKADEAKLRYLNFYRQKILASLQLLGGGWLSAAILAALLIIMFYSGISLLTGATALIAFGFGAGIMLGLSAFVAYRGYCHYQTPTIVFNDYKLQREVLEAANKETTRFLIKAIVGCFALAIPWIVALVLFNIFLPVPELIWPISMFSLVLAGGFMVSGMFVVGELGDRVLLAPDTEVRSENDSSKDSVSGEQHAARVKYLTDGPMAKQRSSATKRESSQGLQYRHTRLSETRLRRRGRVEILPTVTEEGEGKTMEQVEQPLVNDTGARTASSFSP